VKSRESPKSSEKVGKVGIAGIPADVILYACPMPTAGTGVM